MNNRFKNFDFDEWISVYNFYSIYISYPLKSMTTPKEYLMVVEAALLQEKREFFHAQIHVETDDMWDLSSEYLDTLIRFNDFMRIISNPHFTNKEIRDNLLGHRVPDEIEIVENNIKDLLTKLEIIPNNISPDDGYSETNI
jgi:hypothetical protein